MDAISGATPVSSDASSAPAPDTAATSAPPAADASQAPAATQSTEVAASTETGAPAAPASLDDIYNDFKSKVTQETATPEAQAQPDPAEADQPEEEADPLADDEPEPPADAEPQADPDPLADETGIPTRDEINERFKRAPKAVRDFAADMAEQAAEAKAALDRIGGDEGLQVAEAIVPHLFAAQITPETVNGMFNALVDARPQLVAQMGEGFINAALDDERTGEAFGNRLLEGEFGEGYTREVIKELVELDREGLIDREELRGDLGTGREPTARERELEAKLKESEGRVKELSGGKEDATRREEQRLKDTVKDAVSKAVMAEVLPIADKIGWVEKEGNKGPHAGLLARLGKLATAGLNAGLEQTPEWDAIQQLVAEGEAFRDGQPTRAMRVKLNAAAARGKANFRAIARELRPLISLLAGQNAQTPPEDPPPPPTGRSEGGDDSQTRAAGGAQKPRTLDEINAEFDRKMRDSQTPVGTRRR